MYLLFRPCSSSIVQFLLFDDSAVTGLGIHTEWLFGEHFLIFVLAVYLLNVVAIAVKLCLGLVCTESGFYIFSVAKSHP